MFYSLGHMFLKGHFWHVFALCTLCLQISLCGGHTGCCRVNFLSTSITPALVLKHTMNIFHSSTALLLKYSSITHLWGQGEAMEARFPGFLPFLPLFTPLLPAPSHCYGTYQPHIQLLPIHLTAAKHLLTQRPYILQCKVQCCSLFTLFSAAM